MSTEFGDSWGLGDPTDSDFSRALTTTEGRQMDINTVRRIIKWVFLTDNILLHLSNKYLSNTNLHEDASCMPCCIRVVL